MTAIEKANRSTNSHAKGNSDAFAMNLPVDAAHIVRSRLQSSAMQLFRSMSPMSRLLFRLAHIPGLSPRITRMLRRHSAGAEADAIRNSGVFDADWYRASNPDISPAMDPALHYVLHGASEGRDPSPSFRTASFLAMFPEVERMSLNPVAVYAIRLRELIGGREEEESPHWSAIGFFGSDELESGSSTTVAVLEPPASHVPLIADPYLVLAPLLDIRVRLAASSTQPPANSDGSYELLSGSGEQELNSQTRQLTAEWLLFAQNDISLTQSFGRVFREYRDRYPDAHLILAKTALTETDVRPSVKAPNLLFEGPLIDNVVMIRRELFDQLGGFETRGSSAWLYALVLRAALETPVLSVSDIVATAPKCPTPSIGDIAEARRRFLLELFPPVLPPQPISPVSRGLCIIRTTGRRPETLREAVASVIVTDVCTPCVVTHGSAENLEEVKRQLADLPAIILWAEDTERKRGYPLNVALDYLEEHPEFDFCGFLDDDDVVYPLWAASLSLHMNRSGADVVCGLANRRRTDGTVEAAQSPMPFEALVGGNFIPINAFIVRAEFIRQHRIRFPEDLHYLEDWDFLLSLLGSGARPAWLDEYVCEYRMGGDGNSLLRANHAEYETCAKSVGEHGRQVALKLGRARFNRGLSGFRFEDWADLDVLEHLRRVKAFFDVATT